jgi:hypothetical protein
MQLPPRSGAGSIVPCENDACQRLGSQETLLASKRATGPKVEVEVLEESLVVLGGRLVLRAGIAPDAPWIEPSPQVPEEGVFGILSAS